MKTQRVPSSLKSSLLVSCLLLIQVPSFGQAKASQDKTSPDKTASARVSQLLEQSGYSYSKVKDDGWTIPFHGKALPDFDVVVFTAEDLAIFVVFVAEQNELRVTPELMKSLLQMNADADRVKIGIDKKGSLFVRVDASIRLMDVDELKADVEQVAAATDEVAKTAKPYTIVSKPK
jgi:hypothetical protein